MPRLKVPSYRRHKPTNRAVFTLGGRDFYLGPWQYYPKGTDFAPVSNHDLAKRVESINQRPRKNLGYQTSSEVFFGISRSRGCD
jgi:hypothetical protein